MFLQPRLSQDYVVAAKVSDKKGPEFFVSIEIDKEVSGVGNKASRGKLSVGHYQMSRMRDFVGKEV